MSAANRQQAERRVIRGAIRALKAAGWLPLEVNDGGETDEPAATEGAMIEAACAVDQAHLYFKHADHERRCWFMVVFGNAEDGSEVIADYCCPDDGRKSFSDTLDSYTARLG